MSAFGLVICHKQLCWFRPYFVTSLWCHKDCRARKVIKANTSLTIYEGYVNINISTLASCIWYIQEMCIATVYLCFESLIFKMHSRDFWLIVRKWSFAQTFMQWYDTPLEIYLYKDAIVPISEFPLHKSISRPVLIMGIPTTASM